MAGTAVAPRNGSAAPAAPPKDFLAMLDASRGELAKMLPDAKRVERVLRMTRTAWQMDPKLRECSPQSILGSVMRAAELDLDPCGARKHCYLIPYARECTLQVSYMGMLELAHRSGRFRAIEARVVHRSDLFVHEFNPAPVFRHVPQGDWKDEDITHAYAYAILDSGAMVLEVMTRAEIEKVRRTAKSGNVWNSWWGEMAKKTAIKRLLKRQPSSVELCEAMAIDDEHYDSSRVSVRVDGATATKRLSHRLTGALPAPEDESQDVGPDPATVSQEVADEDDEPFEDEVGSSG